MVVSIKQTLRSWSYHTNAQKQYGLEWNPTALFVWTMCWKLHGAPGESFDKWGDKKKKKKIKGVAMFSPSVSKMTCHQEHFQLSAEDALFCAFFIFTKTESHMWGEVAGTAGNQWKQKLHFLLAHVENSPTNQRRRNKTKHMECFSTTTKHFIFSCKSMHVLTTVTLFHKKVLLLFCSLLVYIWWRKMFKIKPKLLFYFVLT